MNNKNYIFSFFFSDTLLGILCFRCSLLQENRDLIFFSVFCTTFVSVEAGVGKKSKSIVSWKNNSFMKKGRDSSEEEMDDRLTSSLMTAFPCVYFLSHFLIGSNLEITTLLFSSKSIVNLIIEFMVEQGTFVVYGQSSSFNCYLYIHRYIHICSLTAFAFKFKHKELQN